MRIVDEAVQDGVGVSGVHRAAPHAKLIDLLRTAGRRYALLRLINESARDILARLEA